MVTWYGHKSGSMKITERQIQILLMDTLLGRRHVSVVPNSKYLSLGEADLLSVTPSGLIHEFEIKCTLADYKAEFKRRREQSYRKSYKHSSLKWAHSGSLPSAKTPNYYWFVTYEFDIDPPDYAGWMLVTDKLYGFKLTEKKTPPGCIVKSGAQRKQLRQPGCCRSNC